MVFSSFFFLFGFLPLCFITYFCCPRSLKNTLLLLWSLFFYTWGTFSFLPIFLAGCVIDFLIAKQIVKSNNHKKIWLGLAVSLNLLVLIYFKYSNFFVHELNSLLVNFGLTAFEWQHVILPIGISFITFQRISYLVDVYRGTAKPATNFISYTLYIALFPQLIAGPIVRYHDVAEQIVNRTHSLDNIWSGISRFCFGLAKKVLIADALGNITANVDKLTPDTMNCGYARLGVICYGLQLYYDFSGYSDMAIGLGRVFGFKLLENFNHPFISQTFTEFWRRWHISLSRVMRDYLYIPLGGNRVGKFHATVNLWIIFLISGLWHGANWTYIAFGAFHGFFMTIDKFGWSKISNKISEKKFGRIFNTLIFLFFLQLSWVLFKSPSIKAAWEYTNYMFNFKDFWNANVYQIPMTIIHGEGLIVLLISIIGVFLPLLSKYDEFIEKAKTKLSKYPIQFAFCLVSLFLCSIVLASTNFTPFIYFQF